MLNQIEITGKSIKNLYLLFKEKGGGGEGDLKEVKVRNFKIIIYIYLSFLILLIHGILIANVKCQGLVGTQDNFMFVLKSIWYDLYELDFKGFLIVRIYIDRDDLIVILLTWTVSCPIFSVVKFWQMSFRINVANMF